MLALLALSITPAAARNASSVCSAPQAGSEVLTLNAQGFAYFEGAFPMPCDSAPVIVASATNLGDDPVLVRAHALSGSVYWLEATGTPGDTFQINWIALRSSSDKK